MIMTVGWLRCSILKGIFSDERVVKIKEQSFFVHRDQVQGNVDQPGKVKVRILRKENGVWAMLPSEDGTMIQVSPDDLEAA